MYPHHPSINSLGVPDGQFQNGSGRFSSQIQSPQVNMQDVPNYEFIRSQLPGKGFSPAHYGHQPSSFGRAAEFALHQQQSLQTQQQQFQVHQLSVEQSGQNQMQFEPHFPETSYSALLHGPDTPPFQQEPSWDTPIAEAENHDAGGTDVSYQGFPNNYNYNMEKDHTADPQPGFYTGPSMHVAGGGPGPAFHPSVSHTLEHSNSGSNLKSEMNDGMTMFPTFPQKMQPKDLFSVHNTNQMMDQNPTSKSHFLSTGQHQSNDIAFRQPRTWNLQNQNCPNMDMTETSFQSLPTSEQNTIQTHQYSMDIDMRNVKSGYHHYQHAENTMPEEGRSKQQQDWNNATREISAEGIANNAWNPVLSQKMYPDPGNSVPMPANSKYNVWNMNSSQNDQYFVDSDASTGMYTGPRNMQTGWQGSHVGPLNSTTTMTDTNFHSYKGDQYSAGIPGTRQGNSSCSLSKSFPSSVGAYDEIHGPWKSHATSGPLASGTEASCSPFNGDRNVRNWAEVINTTPMKSGLIDQQDAINIQQQSYKLLSPTRNMQPLMSQHASNFMKAPSIKSTPNLADTGVSSYGKDDEFEGPQAKRQREFSEFTTPNRRSDLPSNSYLPQNMNFGGGPLRSIQQGGSTVHTHSSELQELGRTFNSNMQQSLDSHVSGADYGHSSLMERKQIMQGSTTLLSSSSLARQGSTISEPPTSLASGQIIDGSLMPPIRSSGEMHGTYAQGNLINAASSAGRNPTQLTHEIGNTHIMHNLTSADLSVHRTKVGNSTDLPIAWKPSSFQHPSKILDHMRSSYEGEKPSHPASTGVQGDELQSNMRKPHVGSFYVEDPSVFPNPNMGHRNFDSESNFEGKLSHKQALTTEESEAPTSNAQVKVQMQRMFTSSSSPPLNGFKPNIPLPQNDRQDWNHFGLSNTMIPQSDAHQGKFSRPHMQMPHPVPKQPHQLQMESENRLLHAQTYRGTWTPKLLENVAPAGGRPNHETVVNPLQNHLNPLTTNNAATYQQHNTPFSEIGGDSTSGKQPYHFPSKDVPRNTNSEPANFELQHPGGHYSRPLNGEQLMPSQSFAFQNPGRQFPPLRLQEQGENQLVSHSNNHSLRLQYLAVNDGEPTSIPRTMGQHLPSMLKSDSIMMHPKKRKNLIPWHLSARQPRGQIISISKAELMWASATNRLPEKNIEEIHNGSLSRARTRLRSTTQLMQQLVLPDISMLTYGNSPNDNEGVMYNLSKVALGEACRLVTNNERESELGQKGADNKTMIVPGQIKTLNIAREAALIRLVERFTERIKNSEKEFSRLEGSLSGLDLKSKTQDLDKFSIVNRLAKTYGTGFIDPPESVNLENFEDYNPGIRRPLPQRYVIAVPVPKTLPENVRCLSL